MSAVRGWKTSKGKSQNRALVGLLGRQKGSGWGLLHCWQSPKLPPTWLARGPAQLLALGGVM